MLLRWTNFLSLIIIACIVLIPFGSSYAKTSRVSTSNYYGADLTQFPPEIRKWIIKEAFPREQMEKAWMKDSKLKAWWSKDGNGVRFKASFTIAKGYQGEGKRKTWGTDTRYDGPNLRKAGKYKGYQTLQFKYRIRKEAARLIKKDRAYADIAKLAASLSKKIEYDWAKYPAYNGAKPRKTRGMLYEVCVGYSKLVVKKALSLRRVSSVEEWVSDDHIWNVINLEDGRKLYLDLTWFDNENIDPKTGKIKQLDTYNWSNLTFNSKLFKYGNMSYSGSFDHAKGSLYKRYEK